jgi:nucleoid-associated protein YgaU
MLKDKYQSALSLAGELGFTGLDVKEEAGKLKIKGTAPYAFDKDLFWDKLKTVSTWQTDVEVNIGVQKTDVYGYYTVKPGDTLSKLAKAHLGDGKRYMEIFNLNKNILKDPDKIQVGQKLQLPAK